VVPTFSREQAGMIESAGGIHDLTLVHNASQTLPHPSLFLTPDKVAISCSNIDISRSVLPTLSYFQRFLINISFLSVLFALLSDFLFLSCDLCAFPPVSLVAKSDITISEVHRSLLLTFDFKKAVSDSQTE
jgi:hypothetical protein